MEAMRALKRRLSDIVYRNMVNDAVTTLGDGPGRTLGGDYRLQRGRLQPRHRRFGEVTSRTRRPPPYDPPQDRVLTQRGAMIGQSRTGAAYSPGPLGGTWA